METLSAESSPTQKQKKKFAIDIATIINLKTIREEQTKESPSIVPKIASTQSGVNTKLIIF